MMAWFLSLRTVSVFRGQVQVFFLFVPLTMFAVFAVKIKFSIILRGKDTMKVSANEAKLTGL